MYLGLNCRCTYRSVPYIRKPSESSIIYIRYRPWWADMSIPQGLRKWPGTPICSLASASYRLPSNYPIAHDPFQDSRYPRWICTAKGCPNSDGNPQVCCNLFTPKRPVDFCRWIVSSKSTPLQSQQLNPFISTLASLVQSKSQNKRDVAVQCLEALLARRECRRAVWAVPGIIAGYATLWSFQ
jgi:hypothetical protein